MAVTPNSNAAFVREVDDELRRDEIASLWRRWGTIAAVVIVVALAAFGAWLLWQQYRQSAEGKRGAELQAAYDQIGADKPQAARATLETLATGGGGYAALARFTQADLLLKRGDIKGAVAKFDAIAADDGTARPFRDLATIRGTAAAFDMLPPQSVIDRLRPLAVKGNPWFGSAGELTAAARLKLGQREQAAALFGQMASDDGVPDSIKQRAAQISGTLTAGGAGTGKEDTTR